MTLEEMNRLKTEKDKALPEKNDGLPEEGHIPVPYQLSSDDPENLTVCVRDGSLDTSQWKQPGEYTIEDYYAWPKDQRVELIDGTIYIMEAPGFVHQRIAAKILSRLDASIEKRKGSCIPLLSPVDVRLDCDDKTMIQPDLIIVCDKDKIKRWGIMGAPDFILEVLSRSTRRKDCTKKLQKYCDAGVREYWIIDPEKKILLTYDFMHDNLPCIYPLAGTAGLALYDGELQIDLDEIAGMIQDWPE